MRRGVPDPNDALGVLLGSAVDGQVTLLESNFSIERLGNIAVRVAPYDPFKFQKLWLVVMPLLPDQVAWLEENPSGEHHDDDDADDVSIFLTCFPGDALFFVRDGPRLSTRIGVQRMMPAKKL